MVLESLFNPFAVKTKPWEMFVAGIVYSFVAIFLSYISFRDQASLLMVFFIVMSAIPLIYNAIKNEEEIDIRLHDEWKLLKEHAKVLIFLMYFFVGVVIALSIAYVVLPTDIVNHVFSTQTQAIANVQSNVQGKVTHAGLFSGIFINNLKVLLFCIIFSFLFGVGAIFILTWNASVVAAAVGDLFKSQIANKIALAGSVGALQYFGVAMSSFMRFMFHGAIEIAAYFIAGIAGSIISIAVIKHNLENETVLYDALDLVLISLALLFVAAITEVYVTPLLFA